MSDNHPFDIAVDLHGSDAGGAAICAKVNRVNNGVFELCSPVYVPPDGWLEMRHPDRSMQCRVAYCEREVSGYRLGLILAGDGDRRSENRIAVALTGVLHMPHSLRLAVRIVDLSRSGLGLELPTPIPVGASARVELDSGTAIGEISHCAKSLHEYRAGMRMREFVPHANARQIMALNEGEAKIDGHIAALLRSVQERQARYEAILFSLASPAVKTTIALPS